MFRVLRYAQDAAVIYTAQVRRHGTSMLLLEGEGLALWMVAESCSFPTEDEAEGSRSSSGVGKSKSVSMALDRFADIEPIGAGTTV